MKRIFVEFGVKNLWNDDSGLQRFMKCLIEMEFTMRSCFLIEIRRINLFANHNLIEWWTISLQFTKTSLLLPLTFFTWQFLGIQGRFSLLRYTDLITQNHDHLNTASQADQTRPSYLLLVLWACVWHTSFPTAMFFFCKAPSKNYSNKASSTAISVFL